MTLERGGIARGKPFPGDLCVCLNDSHISCSSPNMQIQTLPCWQTKAYLYISHVSAADKRVVTRETAAIHLVGRIG